MEVQPALTVLNDIINTIFIKDWFPQ